MKKFFIVDAVNVASLIPSMETAYGHGSVEARLSLDSSLALMEFDIDNLPIGIDVEDGFTQEEVLEHLNSSPLWNETPINQSEFNL